MIKKWMLALCIVWAGTLAACNQKADSEGEKVSVATEIEDPVRLEDLKTAYFASGCFWCVEAIYESVQGVEEAISGYSGGEEPHPTYEQVGRGETGHAEAVKVYYDPKEVDFETLVEVFYDSQDPTQVNGQGPDHGRQYRSIIFYQNEAERQIAEAYKAKLEESGQYEKPIATEIVPFERFWPAEDYHQDYEKLHPNQPYVRNVSIPRLNRFKAKHPELLRKDE